MVHYRIGFYALMVSFAHLTVATESDVIPKLLKFITIKTVEEKLKPHIKYVTSVDIRSKQHYITMVAVKLCQDYAREWYRELNELELQKLFQAKLLIPNDTPGSATVKLIEREEDLQNCAVRDALRRITIEHVIDAQ